MSGIYTLASASNSSLYGNVGCAIKELILRKFPYNFFKYTNVSTEVAFRNIRRNFGANRNTEITKRLKPYLVIQPTYQVPDSDTFMQDIQLTKNEMDIQNRLDARYLFDCVFDKDNGYGLKFKPNRDRIDYDVTVTLGTLHQQIDLYKAMQNQITWNRSLYERAALESVIPKTMIEYMAYLSNIDIINHPDQIPTFMRSINRISAYPINYKIRNASVTNEFFMYYTHNLVVTFTDLNLDTPVKKNMVDDYYQITFRVTVDFNLPGLYVLSGDEKKLQEMRVSIKDTTLHVDTENDDEYIPLYTLTNLYNQYPFTKDGLTLYASTIFHTEKDVTDDMIDLNAIFEADHKQAIKYQTTYGNLPETVSKIYIIKDGEELPPTDYSINWSTFQLNIKNTDHSATYRLLVYLNMVKVNEILINLKDVNSEDRSVLHDNTIDYSKIPTPEVLTDTMVQSEQVIDTTVEGNPVTIQETIPEENAGTTDTKEDIVMKYSSSIFDSDTSLAVQVEETIPTTGKLYSSSIISRDTSTISYKDTPTGCVLESIDVWAKIISSAVLYNYASAIALEKSNNYHLQTDIDLA